MIDAPGHRNYINNMISGATQADIALLVVPAGKRGFESSIKRGNHKKNENQGQTRHHAQKCHVLGISQIIVCINKMDCPSVNWSQHLSQISGLKGDNVMTKSVNMSWWEGFEVKIQVLSPGVNSIVYYLDYVGKNQTVFIYHKK